jgi:hypothetical protein
MVTTPAGARPRRPDAQPDHASTPRRLAVRVLLAVALAVVTIVPAAHAWEAALIEPRVDNLDELLGACARRRDETVARNQTVDAWVAYKATLGEDVSGQVRREAVPACDEGAIRTRLGSAAPAVWAMIVAGGELVYATVNLPSPALLVSGDGGHRWHYRHLFLDGYNVDRGFLLRGIDYRDGLLAVASEAGLLLSADGGKTFTTAIDGKPFSAVAISPSSKRRIVAGGNGTSFLSEDGGATWVDLGFTRFTSLLATRNPFRIDHITSVAFDPADPRKVYVGTGSHLYRFVIDPRGEPGGAIGRWQAMEGNAAGRVLDDSTVYNIEIGERFMISTCNGVYYVDHLSGDTSRDQADVSWGKFRDAAFAQRGIGGPKGNLRAYFVSEDPADPDRVLVADFAGLYEGQAEGARMRWKRVEELPYGSPVGGYPEYTAIAWTRQGETVVGSRYRGIFVQEADRAPAGPGPSCVLR